MGIEKPKNMAEFNAVLEANSDKPAFVDFFATWCPPCVGIKPYIEELAAEFEGKVVFIMVDVDEASDVAEANEIACMPTFKVLKGGAEFKKLEGASREKVREMIVSSLS